MKLGDFTTIVKDLISDTAATVDQRVIDSVHHLSNIFSIPSTDISQSTAIAGTTLAIPTLSVKINNVFIANIEIPLIEDLSDIENYLERNIQAYYISNQLITFLTPFTSIQSTRIVYEKGFVQPAAGLDTDLPIRYNELVTLGAMARYYDKLTASVITSRELYPDVKPDEISTLAKNLWDRYNKLIVQIKLNGKSL